MGDRIVTVESAYRDRNYVYRVLDSTTADVLHKVSVDPGSGWPSRVAMSPDGRRVVAVSSWTVDNPSTFLWWDTATTTVHTEPGPSDEVLGVALTADGRYAAAGLADGTMEVWNLDEATRRSFDAHSGQVTGLAALDAGRVVSISSDGMLTIWDLPAGRQIATIFLEHALTSIACSRDGTTIFAGAHWGNAHALSLVTPA